MKTCIKCKISGIPDSAKYCPKCGRLLMSEHWQNEYADLIKRREALQRKQEKHKQFANDRAKVLTLLEENEVYRLEKEAFCQMLSNQENKRRLVMYVQSPLMIILELAIIVFIIYKSEPSSILFAVIACVAILGGYMITKTIEDKIDKINEMDIKKPNILEAFVQKNRAFYGLNEESNENDLQKILKAEVISPEKISNEIDKLIEEQDLLIKEIESKIKTLEELSTE